ncbi:MAG TPA: MGMT family protein [Bryobacteraceae bacterium]|nr:MGMT family protein [Bryobacteraceae bacterium]
MAGKNPKELSRRLLRLRASEDMTRVIRRIIRQIPRGKVATYAQVAAAAGYPLHHRQVVQILRKSSGSLPWQRVLGAGGQIRLKGEAASDQRIRLEMEGVRFRGSRVDMREHQHIFRPWDDLE